MNHWPECIDIWNEASLGQGDSTCSSEVPRVMYGRALRGHLFI